jgi:hypothetical protein
MYHRDDLVGSSNQVRFLGFEESRVGGAGMVFRAVRSNLPLTEGHVTVEASGLDAHLRRRRRREEQQVGREIAHLFDPGQTARQRVLGLGFRV